jgi:hydrogenase maturation protease
MTLQQIDGRGCADVRRRERTATLRRTQVEVLVCGSADRGDDGAGRRALVMLTGDLPEDIAVLAVGQLDIDDLLAVPEGAGVIVVDAAIGIHPGQIVDLPLIGLIGRTDGLRLRSANALAFPEVVGLAGLLRGRPMRGRVLAIGGITFGLGEPLSWPVVASMPEFVLAILGAVDRERAGGRAV